MKTSPSGLRDLEQREGVRLKAYRDTRGILTIGVGHTSAAGEPRVTEGLTITQAQCDEIFARDIAKFEEAISRLVKVPLSQNEYDALVSLVYNIGEGNFTKSSVLRYLNARDRQGAADAFLLWKNAGGKPVLLNRRKAERLQFLRPDAPKPTSVPVVPPVNLPAPVEPPKLGPQATVAGWLNRAFSAIQSKLKG